MILVNRENYLKFKFLSICDTPLKKKLQEKKKFCKSFPLLYENKITL